MALRKSKVSGGYAILERDKRLTLSDKTIPLHDKRFEITLQDLEIQFLERILARDPAHEDALRILGHLCTAMGQHEKGLEIDRRLVRLCPSDPAASYNLACSFSLLNRLDQARDALQKALDLGFEPFSQVENDPDLANLRRSPHYQEIISRYGRKAAGR